MLKDTVRKAREVVDEPTELQSFSFKIGRPTATLFVKPSQVVPPAWVGYFDGHVDLRSVQLRSASSAAVLVLRVGARWFAVTFGYGRHLLRQGIWEPNFGLRVTLNSIADSSIRSIDRKSFDAIARHTREEASRAGSMQQFGINVEEDLLRAVVGKPEDTMLGRSIAGMDGLTVTVAVALSDLPAQIERYMAQWRKRRYRERYPWVDQIGEIRDRRQARELDERLVERLAARELDQTWLAVPVPIDWSQVGGFRFSTSERAGTHDDIHLVAFFDSLRDPESLSPETLKRKSVYCLDPDGRHARDRWPVYQCLYAEIRDGEDVFLLTGGRWYRVARRFVQRIDGDVAELQATTYVLPPYRHGSEKAYNEEVARGDGAIALMDGKNVRYGGGASQIEFCDLFIRKRAMVHVKRYGGSSVLSHLFAQGVVSATLFLQDAEFRREVRQKLPNAHRHGVPDGRPRPERYEVAFAIVSRSPGDLVLPFFSKVNLRNAARTLEGLGYRVTLTRIPVEGDAP
ncbi:MAG: TIGR04141 family sporadically distributed protein [Planctomycetota bacterium]